MLFVVFAQEAGNLGIEIVKRGILLAMGGVIAEGRNDVEHPRETLAHCFIVEHFYSNLIEAVFVEIDNDSGSDKTFVDDDVPVVIVLLLHS